MGHRRITGALDGWGTWAYTPLEEGTELILLGDRPLSSPRAFLETNGCKLTEMYKHLPSGLGEPNCRALRYWRWRRSAVWFVKTVARLYERDLHSSDACVCFLDLSSPESCVLRILLGPILIWRVTGWVEHETL